MSDTKQFQKLTIQEFKDVVFHMTVALCFPDKSGVSLPTLSTIDVESFLNYGKSTAESKAQVTKVVEQPENQQAMLQFAIRAMVEEAAFQRLNRPQLKQHTKPNK